MLAKAEHKLLRGAAVLLPPQLGEERGQKPVKDLKLMDQGVVSWAEGDEQLLPGDARPAVVDVEALRAFRLSRLLAGPAGVAIAREDPQSQSGKEEKIASVGGVTGPAKALYERR